MRIKRKMAIAIALGVVLGAVATAAAAGVLTSLYSTPFATTMIFGGDGGAGVDSLNQAHCALIGVGSYRNNGPCAALLATPYEETETPITASSGRITYFAVTSRNAAAGGGAARVVFAVRLCGSACNAGDITTARCSPLPGSKTCSWIGSVPFQQWQPGTLTACGGGGGGACHGSNAGAADRGLIDIVARCLFACPNGTYEPGEVTWSVAYVH